MGRFQRTASSVVALIAPQDCSSNRLPELAFACTRKLLLSKEPSGQKPYGALHSTYPSAAGGFWN